MIRIKTSLDHKRIRRLVWLVLTIFVLFGYSLQSVTGAAYYSMVMQNYATVNSPAVILQNGTVGTSTIYTNNTSAKVSVEAPLFDYVDNNEADADSSVDKGMHSNFTAQQAGPDSTYDTLTEENTEAIEDYVDNNLSDVDNSSDVGSHSNFENQKDYDSIYDTLTEQNTAAGGEITKVGTDTSGTGTNLTLSFSHTLVSGTSRIVIVSIGVENGDTIDVFTVTYGGVTMTLAVEGIVSSTGFFFLCEIWYILENDLPSDGSQTVEITCSGTAYELEVNGFCSEYTGVTQGAPEATVEHNQTIGTTITNDISPSDNAWVISVVGSGNPGSFTHGQSQVEVLDFQDTSSTFAVAELRGASGETSLDSTYSGTLNRLERVAASWTVATEEDNYELDLEIQFTDVIDFLPTEALCINTGTFSGTEGINVDFWNGTGWENLATDLTAYSSNEYSVSLTSTTFTIRFKGGNETGDATQNQWQIDATLLRVEGVGSKEDAVDNDTSDVDSSADIGTLSDFNNMKAADSTYANLTESAPGGITHINSAEASATLGTSAQVNKPTNTVEDDFMIALLVSTIGADTDGSTMFSAPSGWVSQYNYTQNAVSGQHVYIYWRVAGASEPSSYTWTWTDSCGWVAQITTFRGVDTASPIHVQGTVNQETSDSPMSPSLTTTTNNAMIWIYDMSDGSVIPATGGAPGGTTWIDQTEIATPGNGVGISTAYFVQASAGATSNRDWTLDASDENSGQQYALKPAPTDYQLDQEVQWTDVPYSLPNEELCIYGGTMGVEDITVDVWNGTGWEIVFTDLSSGWNNASMTDWLTTSNFTIRFKGGNETGDSSQDTWQIDVALIHVWSVGGESYELNLEVQWTSAEYTRTNEELCIRTGTFSGSENIQVTVWNNTGSSWHWVMNLTASQWNNVSITSYLTSSTFTVRFLGGTETGDTTQDSWNIDATLLRIWTSEGNYDYVDNNTSNVDSSADKGTHGNFTAQQYGPDLINDTLTESLDGGGTVWLWQEDTSGYSPTSSFQTYQFWNSWTTNSTTSGTVTKIGIYVFADPGNSPQVKLGIYEDNSTNPGSPGNLLGETNATTITGAGWLDLDIVGSGINISSSTTYHVGHITNIAPTTQWRYRKTATPVSDFRDGVAWDNLFDPAGATTKSGSYRYGAYRVGYDEPANYRLDLEVQWTNADYATNGELAIYVEKGNTHSLDATGGYMIIGDGTPDWGSATGTISFWVKWDTVANRPWGQHDNMETRFSGGTNLILDWGAVGSITSGTSFSAGKWYFIAIVWNENTDDLYLYVGDQNNAPTLDTYNNNWITSVSTAGVTQNNFMASKNGVEPMDGHGDDLRYWNIDRTLTEIQSDYNTELNGSETNLRSYFKLNNNFDDMGPNNNDGSGSGSYSFSTDVPFPEKIRVDVWNGTSWQNLFTDLANGWNNVSVSSYLNSSLFTIRFKGGNETGDPTQDNWDIDATLLYVWTSNGTFDYVLRVNNTITDSWQVRLKKFADSNISRLQNCTIYFHNSTDGTSNQIIIENGSYINQTGPWYDLGDSETIYIAMTIQANDATTSNIYAYLEIRTPNTTTYAQYVVTFEIT